MQSSLLYVHDPMCSWCWGFSRSHDRLMALLEDKLTVKRYLGGLAPDSDVDMPESMQQGLQNTWRNIQQHIPGTEFNFDFWSDCKPRRSTYPSNRAVIAARLQGKEFDLAMTQAIQRAYYLEAKNPSDYSTHIELAKNLGLDAVKFEEDVLSESVNQDLMQELQFTRSIGLNSFPSIAVEKQGQYFGVPIEYNNPEGMYELIISILS